MEMTNQIFDKIFDLKDKVGVRRDALKNLSFQIRKIFQ